MINVERDPVYMAAADWFARLREPDVSVEEMLAWQEWMGERDSHAQAFAQVEQVSAILQKARRPVLAPLSQEAADRYDASVPLSEWREPRRRFQYAIAASIVLASIAVGWVALRQESGELLRTATGENRTVVLADGSKIVLGGNTEVETLFDEKRRDLELRRGEAFFTVAKDPSRPFKVTAGDATVTAVGTEFNVRRGSDRTVVAVVEGRVIVEQTAAPLPLLGGSKGKHAPVSMIAGEETRVSAEGVAAPAPSPDPSAATAWQSGRLAFQMETLRHVLEDVNRYAPKPIVVEDDAVGDLRITATVIGGNVDGLISSMEQAFGLTAIDEVDRIVLRGKPGH
jgi:transmembrane sensor